MLIRYSKKAPQLHRRLQFLEHLNMIANAAAVAIAVPGTLSHWVSFAVSVKVLIMNITEYQAYGMRLGAINGGLRDLRNLGTWWNSLSVIDRRTRMAKTHVVTV